jgi:Gpi18-like mannosyltransferase
MLWWFNLTKWFDTARTSGEAAYSIGYLVSTKLLPIFADLGIAALIYTIAKKIKTTKFPYLWPAIYLFSPYSFYLSALWGQYDQLGYLVVLVAFILEAKNKYPWLTPFLFALSAFTKPTTLIFAPFFIYLYVKNRHNVINFGVSVVLILLFFVETTKVFTNDNLIYFTTHDLYEKIFLKSASRLSANAFNFWSLLMTSKINTQDARFLFIPAYIWSAAAYITLNLIAFTKTKKVTLENVIKGLFIIGTGSWLFMTNMLDRYLFAGLTSGLILSIYNRKLLKYWIPLSLIFCLNLYNQWWFPEILDPLKNAMLWQNNVLIKILSVVNIGLFIKMISLL